MMSGEMLVLYGSETGNCIDLAEILGARLRRQHHRIKLKSFGRATTDELKAADRVFVVCSTTGQGAVPRNCQPLWNSLLKRDLPGDLLAGTSFSCFGLGDSVYPKFNWAIRKVSARLVQLGATEEGQRGEGDEKSPDGYEVTFDQWLDLVVPLLDNDIPVFESLPPLYRVSTSAAPIQISPQLSRQQLPHAKLQKNMRITPESHFQDVRLLTLSLASETAFEPGDAVALYPTNSDEDVKTILAAQPHFVPLLDEQLDVDPEWAASVEGGVVTPLTLRKFLVYHADLNSIPRRSFFATASHFCSSERQAERMLEFCNELQDLYDYANRPRRSIAETIAEFDTLRIPIDYLLDIFPILRPRQFSIASAPSANGELDLCVSIVKYKTRLRRIRYGVCTRWMAGLLPGATIEYSLVRQKLHIARRATSRPVLLIATGTGIAPIRSLLRSRQLEYNPKTLVFGCRYRDRDFLFSNEWPSQTNLEVMPAFSREGGGYVQQQIGFHPRLDIENAMIFVCGSSGQMPKAVREALIETLERHGFGAADAEALLTEKERTGLYIQDTW